MHGRRAFDPADAVIWVAAALLALLCGAGGGFFLWSVFAGVGAPTEARAIVYVAAIAVGAIAFRRSLHLRLCLMLAAASLVVSFALGSSLWAPLFGG